MSTSQSHCRTFTQSLSTHNSAIFFVIFLLPVDDIQSLIFEQMFNEVFLSTVTIGRMFHLRL